MILYIVVTAVVCFLGRFVNTEYRRDQKLCTARLNKTAEMSKQELLNKAMLLGIFFVLFILSAVRVGIGNDYWEYRTGFLLINGGETPVSYEYGFRWVVLLMQKLFYRDCYREIFALFSFLTAFFFVRGLYDTSDWFFYSLFMFMTNGFYFMSFSNVRYYFAFGIVLFSLRFFLRKDYLPFIFWIVVAAFFHMTVLSVIPVFFVAYYLKWTKKTIWLIPAACLALIVGKPIVRRIIFIFYPFYEGSYLDVSSFSIWNILKCSAVLLFGLIFFKRIVEKENHLYMFFNLNLFALVLYCFGTYIPELSRICYFMVIGQFLMIPGILKRIEALKERLFWTLLIVGGYSCYFIIFLKQGYSPYIQILPYLTWLFG